MGRSTGNATTTGSNNAFFGYFTGAANTTGQSNAFFGPASGSSNTTGSNNTIIGTNADVASSNLSFATAIGAGARVSANNTIVLGRNAGEDTVQIPGALNLLGGLTANLNVGIGTAIPKAKLEVTGGSILVGSPGQGIILKSPDGSKCTKLEIDNNGDLQINKLSACP